MLLVLVENEFNCITSVIDHIISLYDKESVVRISGSRTKDDIAKMLMKKPLLSTGWLIICTEKINSALIRDWNLPFNNIILHVTTRSKLKKALEVVDGLEYKVVDNYSIEDEAVKKWVRDQLKCSEAIASSILARCNHRISNIVLAVDVLKHFDQVTSSLVGQYVPKVNTVSVNDLVLYLLGIQKKGVMRREVVKTVSEFRYAYKWLLNTVDEQLDTILSVFYEMSTGALSLENFKDFLKSTNDKQFKDLSEFKLKKIIEMHSKVSTEYVYFLKLYVSGIPRSYYGLHKLLYLIKTMGE